MKHQSYLNRALTARDPRFARIFGKLGYDVASLATEAGVELEPIPDGCRGLPWPALRALASAISDQPIKKKDDAVTAIEMEIDRRSGVDD